MSDTLAPVPSWEQYELLHRGARNIEDLLGASVGERVGASLSAAHADVLREIQSVEADVRFVAVATIAVRGALDVLADQQTVEDGYANAWQTLELGTTFLSGLEQPPVEAQELFDRFAELGGPKIVLDAVLENDAVDGERGGQPSLQLRIIDNQLYIGDKGEVCQFGDEGLSQVDQDVRKELLHLLTSSSGVLYSADEIIALLAAEMGEKVDIDRLPHMVAGALDWVETLTYLGEQLMIVDDMGSHEKRYVMSPGVSVAAPEVGEQIRDLDAIKEFQGRNGHFAIYFAVQHLGRLSGWFEKSDVRSISDTVIQKSALDEIGSRAVEDLMRQDLDTVFLDTVASIITNDAELIDIVATTPRGDLAREFAVDMLRRSHDVRQALAEILRGGIRQRAYEDNIRRGTMSGAAVIVDTELYPVDANGHEIPPLRKHKEGLPGYLLAYDDDGRTSVIEDGGPATNDSDILFMSYPKEALPPGEHLMHIYGQVQEQRQENPYIREDAWMRVFMRDIAERCVAAGLDVRNIPYPARRLSAALSGDVTNAVAAYAEYHGHDITTPSGHRRQVYPVNVAIGFVLERFPDLDDRQIKDMIGIARKYFEDAHKRQLERVRAEQAKSLLGVAYTAYVAGVDVA